MAAKAASALAPSPSGGKALTVAQIKTAFKDNQLTQADALQRIEAHGYTAADAAILLGTAPAGPVIAPPTVG